MTEAATSGEHRFHELMLSEVRTTVGKLGEKVDAYHEEAAMLHSKLDLHIATCDMRYAAAQKDIKDHTPRASPILRKGGLLQRVFDGMMEHLGLIVVLTTINALFFAWTHGFHQIATP